MVKKQVLTTDEEFNKLEISKATKNPDVVSNLMTHMEIETEVGDILLPRPTAEKLILSNGKNPHPNTIKAKWTEWFNVFELLKKFKPRWKDGWVDGIERIQEDKETTLKIERIEKTQELILNNLNKFQVEFKKFVNNNRK